MYGYHSKKSYITKSHVKKNTLLCRQYSISLKQRHNDRGCNDQHRRFCFYSLSLLKKTESASSVRMQF